MIALGSDFGNRGFILLFMKSSGFKQETNNPFKKITEAKSQIQTNEISGRFSWEYLGEA